MNQICCIGHITHDRIITPQRTMEMAGGMALYFSWALHAIDPTFDFSLVTKVGDESMDEVQRLREAGVDVTRYGCPHSVFFENVYGSVSIISARCFPMISRSTPLPGSASVASCLSMCRAICARWWARTWCP